MPNKIILSILFICFFGGISSNAYAEDDKIVKILVLNSYNKGFHWVDGIVEAVESGLNTENFSYDLRVEYMDSKATKYTPAFEKQLHDLYSFKYENEKFDILICSDDHAFDFLRKYRAELFPDTPIVFCGVNNTNAATLIDHDYFTGVLETPDQDSMINLALKLHPGLKKIYVIADTTPSGKYRWEKQTVPLIPLYPDIEFIHIDDSFSLQEIEEMLLNLPDDAITFYAVLTRDKTGRYFPLKEIATQILRASKRPTYTFLSQDLEYGLLGGNVLDGYHQGKIAIQMAIRILKGESISDIPVNEKPTSQFMFNYPQLMRYGINPSDLPEDSFILNKPVSFYQQNRQAIWSVLSVFSFLITIIGVLAFYILRSRKAERQRRMSEEKLRLIFENSPVGISTVDLQGKFVTTNPAYEKMLGYSKEELKELSFYDVTHPDYRLKNKELAQKMFSLKSTGFKIEKKYIRKDGAEINVNVYASAVRDDMGETKFGTAFVEDITKRIKAEEEQEKLQAQLTQAQRLESVGILAGGVAHDYNNMLTIIIGYSESILAKLGVDDPLHGEITQILHAGKRSADITLQLLAFARKQTTVPKIIDLNDSIERMLKMLRRLIGEDIDLAWHPGTDIWPVKIDPSQIDQILANLCVNARDAIEDTGQVTIETQNISFDEEFCANHAGFIPGDYVMLGVSDTGSGMPPEVLDKIFEPFFTTKGVHLGTGLGLSTVYGIIHQNNGFINVYSEIDKGTTIKCYFLKHAGQKDKRRLKNDQNMPLSHGETILLVEDDKAIIELGEKMLKSLGYAVLSAHTPGHAIRLHEKNIGKIDLLLTDVVMPEMNGRELSDRLKKQYPKLKTLYMSGYTADVIAHRGVVDKGVCFIPKPLSQKELSLKVREALENTDG